MTGSTGTKWINKIFSHEHLPKGTSSIAAGATKQYIYK